MMDEIVVLIEHRKGEIRDVSFEVLALGRKLAERSGASLVALLLGGGAAGMAEAVASHAPTVEVYDVPELAQFVSDAYQAVLLPRLRERKPSLLMMGHTSYGIELAPGLAAALELPLIMDATDVGIVDGAVEAVRPVYGGKARARVLARGESAVVTIQPGAFVAGPAGAPGRVVRGEVSLPANLGRKRFLGFIESPSEDVDITRCDVVVSVGRGIGGPENLPVVEELAEALGGVLACSRPVVDKKWLPKSRQVGISGKTVQPKLYLAVGISGAFQHLVGMKGAKTIVAINKDPSAPIFRVADYGVVADLFQVVPALTERIRTRTGK